LDVAQPEVEARAVCVAARIADDLADERHLAVVIDELARADGRRPAARDRGIEEEDREDGRDRERDDQARRTAVPGHARDSTPVPAVNR
jgi:hypothetical protein